MFKRIVENTLLVIASVALLSNPSSAAEQKKPPGLPALGQASQIDPTQQVKGVKRLPVTGLAIVETSGGQTYLVSDNGRVGIIGGRWMDMWEGKPFTNIEDSASLDKLNFGRMGIDLDDFSPWVIGTGRRAVTVFVDPVCESCRQLVRQMEAMGKDYTFKVVLLPLAGKESGAAARKMHCSPNRQLALQAFLNNSYGSLPEPAQTCDVLPIQKAMVTSLILGVKATPYAVLPDFTTVSGPAVATKLNELVSRK